MSLSTSQNFDENIVFIIPNDKNHGAQNFFKRLFKEFPHKNKIFFKESDFKGFFSKFYFIFKTTKKPNTVLFTTVNSNVIGLLIKIFLPKIKLITRLGNTISQELERNSLGYFKHKFFYMLLSEFSDAVIFQSSLMKNDFLNFFSFNDKQSFFVIHNGVEVQEITSLNIKAKKVDSSKVIFLLVGTFKFQKGYDIFFEALKLLKPETKLKVRFIICGDGPLFDEFKKMSASLKGLDVSFEGMVDPSSYYLGSDVYISCSRYEGFSNSIIEALSFGLPCIVSNCPSSNEEVISKDNGIFFQNENPIDLASKIELMHANFTKFNKEKIIEAFTRDFSIKSIAEEYINLIK